MADHSHIEWTEATWNPVVGCRKVSAGCRNCYAIRDGHRMAGNPNPKVSETYSGLTMVQNGRLNWTGVAKELPDRLSQPFHWKKPRRVFVNSQSDLFQEGVSDGFIACVWDAMGRAGWHDYQILTKRPGRMRDWVGRWSDIREPGDLQLVRGPEATRAAHPSGRGQLFAAMLETWGDPPSGCTWPTFDWAEGQKWWPGVLPNVWLGTSVEDQRAADERIPYLLETPAAVRFLSCEPLLGPVDLKQYLADFELGRGRRGNLHWVIIGGESGPRARPCEEEWVANLLCQCRAAGLPAFVKQMGSVWAARHGAAHRKGGDMDEWRENLQVREFPA